MGLTFNAEQLTTIERYIGGHVPSPADLHGLTLDQLEFTAGYLRARAVRAELRATVQQSSGEARPANVTPAQFDAIYREAIDGLTATLAALEKREGSFGDGARFAMSTGGKQ